MKSKTFIPGMYDVIFKTIMTKISHRDFVKCLIKEITNIEEETLHKDFIQLNSKLPINHKTNKKGEVDILYCYNKKNYINFEMNLEYSKSLLIKNNYYHCKLIGEKFYSGKKYTDGKVFLIKLNNFKIEKLDKDINMYKIMNTYTYHVENENFIKYHVDMEKIKKRCYNKDNLKLTPLERMILILVVDDKEKLIELAGNNIMLQKVVRRIIDMNNEEYCIGMYDKEEVDKMFQEMLKAEYREDGRIEGMKEGKRKGLKEGRKEGKIEGKIEALKGVAKNLLKENIDISIIMKITGFTKKQIESLE